MTSAQVTAALAGMTVDERAQVWIAYAALRRLKGTPLNQPPRKAREWAVEGWKDVWKGREAGDDSIQYFWHDDMIAVVEAFCARNTEVV